MESAYKMTEHLRKKRPVPRKFNTYKEFDATLFKGPSSHLQNSSDVGSYIHKLSSTKTPERSRPNIPTGNYSFIPELIAQGKENRSSSVSKKEERSGSLKRNTRDKQNNYTWLNEKSFTVDIQGIEAKRPELAKFQAYMSSDRNNVHKKNLSSKRTVAGNKQVRRLNSSCADARSRLPSQDRRPIHANKNSSFLNNSLLLDEPGNVSRDQSYLKELLEEDASHISDTNAGNYISASPNRMDETCDDSYNVSRHILKVHEEDAREPYDKHNMREREKPAPLYEKVLFS